MMVDEVAGRLNIDAIELRKKNVFQSGMKNTQGAIPAGALRLDEILDKAAQHEIWKDRVERKKRFDAEDPDNLYGVGFAICQKDFGTGSEAPMASLEFSADGRVSLRQIAIDMGTGMATAQALLVADYLGQPADEIKTGETEWSELALTTSSNPYIISQAEQDAALRNPRWPRRRRRPTPPTTPATPPVRRRACCLSTVYGRRPWPFGAVASMAVWPILTWCVVKMRTGSRAS
jgi:CO/xanthine dehydrogenase Mo-binding subunit